MPLEIKFDPAEGIIESIFTGDIGFEELESEAYQTIELSKNHKVNKFLCDGRKAVVSQSIVAALDLERISEQEQVDRLSKIAIIAPESPETLHFAKFYETACLNRGWNVSVFEDRESAAAWLLKPFD